MRLHQKYTSTQNFLCFIGGNLSSNSGLFIVIEFIRKIRLNDAPQQIFGEESIKIDSVPSVIKQLIHQNIAEYHRGGAVDHFRFEPVFTSQRVKEPLTSQTITLVS